MDVSATGWLTAWTSWVLCRPAQHIVAVLEPFASPRGNIQGTVLKVIHVSVLYSAKYPQPSCHTLTMTEQVLSETRDMWISRIFVL